MIRYYLWVRKPPCLEKWRAATSLMLLVFVLLALFSINACTIQNTKYKPTQLVVDLKQELDAEDMQAPHPVTEDELRRILAKQTSPYYFERLVVDDLLPFNWKLDEALNDGDAYAAQAVCREWQYWLGRIRPKCTPICVSNIDSRVHETELLQQKLSDPINGPLFMKMIQAVKSENWEEAKAIGEVLNSVASTNTIAPAKQTEHFERQPYPTATGTQNQECDLVRAEYRRAEAAYLAAKSDRDSSGMVSNFMGWGAGLPTTNAKTAAFSALISVLGRQESNSSQQDMNHLLVQMNSAKTRAALACDR